MEMKLKAEPTARFATISVGEVFRGAAIYMRTLSYNVGGHVNYINAVDLVSGHLTFFEDHAMVTPLAGAFVED